jgi:hypothetical protein
MNYGQAFFLGVAALGFARDFTRLIFHLMVRHYQKLTDEENLYWEHLAWREFIPCRCWTCRRVRKRVCHG